MDNFYNSTCVVVVDIRSAHNIGSIFRTCDGFSADLVIVGASPYPRIKNDNRLPHVITKAESLIVKTSLGAEKTVDWSYYENFEQLTKELKLKGYTVVAIEQSSLSKPIETLKRSKVGRVALVFGREVTGLSEEELNLCDGSYEIPMKGFKESFNVSVAVGISLYQATL